MWFDGCSQEYSVPQRTWIYAQINKAALGEGTGYKQPPISMWYSETICDFMFQVSFSTGCSFLKVSAKTKKGLSLYSSPLWHNTHFQGRNWPQDHFSECLQVTFHAIHHRWKSSPFFLNRQSGRRERYGVAVQKEHKAKEGWKGAFLLQVVTCGKAMGETSVDLVRILPRLSLHVPFDTDPYTDISWCCPQERSEKPGSGEPLWRFSCLLTFVLASSVTCSSLTDLHLEMSIFLLYPLASTL